MADLNFAKHTEDILDMLPYWFKIRKKSENSIGARYLNIAGLELDDARYALDWAYDQCYIESADINQADFCYKAILPMSRKLSEVTQVRALNTILYEAETLKDFFGINRHGIADVNLHSFESFFLDIKRNIIYVRKKFNIDALNDNGKIALVFNDDTANPITFPLVPHQVWNYFDELGALMSCPRLPEEPNIEYKERIMDVFKNYANASRDGVANGIARELSMRRNIKWPLAKSDLELLDPMIVLNSIKVGGEYFPRENIFISASGTVVLKALDEQEDNLDVTYIHGLEMHEFHAAKNTKYVLGKERLSFDNTNNSNPYDIKLYNELFTVEEKPKPKLLEYINTLNSESPIFWDDFRWNEHYWDQNEAEVSGVGFIPHLYNGSIRGFKNYNG